MLMALNGNPALELLLNDSLDIDARDEEGNTALLYASRFFVRGGQRRNGWMLLRKGADVNASNSGGVTALMIAAADGRTNLVALLVHSGANVAAQSERGDTALSIARAKGHEAVIKLLDEAAAPGHPGA